MSKEQLQAAVDSLATKYTKPVEADQTRDILSACISALGGLFAQPTTITEARPQHYFRARLARTFQDDNQLRDPSQYSYLPKHLCTSMGRCHVPGHPVFYASNNFETAIMETMPKIGELALVALWILPPKTVSYLKFLCPSNAEEYVAAQRDEIYKGIDETYPDYDNFNRTRIRAHCAAWSDLFLASSGKHSLSASIAHEILYGEYGDGSIDAVCYGSIVDPRFANYALHTDLADSLQLYRVYACHTTDQPNYFLFSKCADLDTAAGTLEWRDMSESDYFANDSNIPGSPIYTPY